ncbi:MAG: methyltransferase domain-containing protein [candidate division Zixibacteria bacterium]|nr:methyltransferase domain-containing protein [candidate division Zixibacteria bacterium]
MNYEDIKQNRLYDEFAHLWNLISNPQDYALEAAFWKKALRDKLGPGRHEILELGVGGGHNLSHLKNEFRATAVDISDKMLDNSRRLNPEVEHLVGDMRSVRLGRIFRAVIIHDAINYMLTEDDLHAALRTAAEHLDPGGVFVTSPDYTTETFTDGVVRHGSCADENTRLVHIEYEFDPDPDDTTYEYLMIYLIREKGQLRIEHDRHVTGLFREARWLELIEDAGFEVEKYAYDVHDDKRQSYLFVGVKK